MILNGDHPRNHPSLGMELFLQGNPHKTLSRLSGTHGRRSAQMPLAGFDRFCTSCHPLRLLWLLPLSSASEYCPLAE